MIRENLVSVQKNIEEGCERAGRNTEDVRLIAVSKTKPIEALKEAYEAGCRDFGENKVQELTEKYEELPKDIRWHMIGHLQRNKVKYLVGKVYMLVREIAALPGICVRGLMTIAPYVEKAEDNRQYFVNLRQLSVDIKNKNIDNVSMDVLSMGMTGDYTVAVEEGATYVRVGTGIFGERDYGISDQL